MFKSLIEGLTIPNFYPFCQKAWSIKVSWSDKLKRLGRYQHEIIIDIENFLVKSFEGNDQILASEYKSHRFGEVTLTDFLKPQIVDYFMAYRFYAAKENEAELPPELIQINNEFYIF
mgnify:CR=1 FL=1